MSLICSHCGKECKNKNSLAQHEIRCKNNPQRIKTNAGRKFGKRKKIVDKHTATYTCPYCKKTWLTDLGGFRNHSNHCKSNKNAAKHNYNLSDAGRLKIGLASKARGAGGYAVGKFGGHGKRGYYKGYYCMSSWELAWLIYQLDTGKIVEQCHDHFEYEFEGKVHKYTPDFIIDGIYYEIKNWHRPDTDAKLAAIPADRQCILIEGSAINFYLEYVINKYGANFTDLYEK